MNEFFDFDDTRIDKRAAYSFDLIERDPGRPLPDIFSSGHDLEGFYRLINNNRFTTDRIMDAAATQSVEGLSEGKEVAVIHDTTFINPKFNKKSNTLGQRGLGVHLSLLATSDSCPAVLGPVNLDFIIRDKEAKKTIKGNERDRWIKAVKNSEKKLEHQNLTGIHIMDREGDLHGHFCDMNESGYRFVIRAKHDRSIADSCEERLFPMMRNLKEQFKLEANLSKKEYHRPEDKLKSNNLERSSRKAELSVSSISTIIENLNPYRNKKYAEEFEVNIVRVWESNPPKGEAGIEWILLTSESIKNKLDIKKIISLYRRRWLIEEFFKGLKTGCNIESKQFESIDSWKKLVAFYLPITVKILNLRLMDQLNLNHLKFSLSKTQKKILNLMGIKKRGKKINYLDSLALLGGHIKYNGPPGWIVLFRGYKKLQIMEEARNLKM